MIRQKGGYYSLYLCGGPHGRGSSLLHFPRGGWREAWRVGELRVGDGLSGEGKW